MEKVNLPFFSTVMLDDGDNDPARLTLHSTNSSISQTYFAARRD
jgi:hypothetical protein